MTWEVDIRIGTSPTHGTGIFAQQFIPAGTRVWSFDDSMYVCTADELKAYDSETLRKALLAGYLHEPTERFIWYQDGMQFVNHAEGAAANIGTGDWRPLEDDGCIATRDIEAGEEIFEDYGFWTIFNLPANHWLRLLYLEFCPQHYYFMQSLSEVRKAA